MFLFLFVFVFLFEFHTRTRDRDASVLRVSSRKSPGTSVERRHDDRHRYSGPPRTRIGIFRHRPVAAVGTPVSQRPRPPGKRTTRVVVRRVLRRPVAGVAAVPRRAVGLPVERRDRGRRGRPRGPRRVARVRRRAHRGLGRGVRLRRRADDDRATGAGTARGRDQAFVRGAARTVSEILLLPDRARNTQNRSEADAGRFRRLNAIGCVTCFFGATTTNINVASAIVWNVTPNNQACGQKETLFVSFLYAST